MRTTVLLFLLLGLGFEAVANYSLQIGNVFWIGSPGGYNCFTSSEFPNTVNFTITKTRNGNRSYAVTAGPSTTSGTYLRQLSSGANRLSYQLYTTSARTSILKAPPAAAANEVISGSSSAATGTVIPLSFIMDVPANQIVEPGTYTDTVTISIFDRFNSTGAPFDTRTITLTVVVTSGAALSVVPTGSAFSTSTSQNLNFGTLSTGQVLGCDVLVRKNTGCTLTFTSGNGGAMKRVPATVPDAISYSFSVNGTALDLSTPATVTLPSGVSPTADGSRLPVSVTVGDVSGAAAGNYQDEITITLVAQ